MAQNSLWDMKRQQNYELHMAGGGPCYKPCIGAHELQVTPLLLRCHRNNARYIQLEGGPSEYLTLVGLCILVQHCPEYIEETDINTGRIHIGCSSAKPMLANDSASIKNIHGKYQWQV